ncbi:carboxypeptidase-like regulatory domain-containing protein, partial [Rubrivirga litoralis]
MLARLLVACGVLALAPGALAQAVVTGRVVDAETGAPLPGVHVYLSGTTTGDVTDRGGAY